MGWCLRLGFLLGLVLLSACGDDTKGDGQIKVTVYGEPFIEDGIPADAMNDGWSVQFTRFVVTVTDVTVAGVTMTDTQPIELAVSTGGVGQEMGQVTASAGTYSGASFRVTRIDLAGRATKDANTKTFAWTFEDQTHYTDCDVVTAVVEGGVVTFQITIHADHFLNDSLVAAEPQVLFGALAAADTDGDNDITQAELEATGIGAYDPGNQDIDTLWGWLKAQSKTIGHANGERHCTTQH